MSDYLDQALSRGVGKVPSITPRHAQRFEPARETLPEWDRSEETREDEKSPRQTIDHSLNPEGDSQPLHPRAAPHSASERSSITGPGPQLPSGKPPLRVSQLPFVVSTRAGSETPSASNVADAAAVSPHQTFIERIHDESPHYVNSNTTRATMPPPSPATHTELIDDVDLRGHAMPPALSASASSTSTSPSSPPTLRQAIRPEFHPGTSLISPAPSSAVANVLVSIGRIEVVLQQSPASTPKLRDKARARPALPLADYLRQREPPGGSPRP